jgi:hypothetical protein
MEKFFSDIINQSSFTKDPNKKNKVFTKYINQLTSHHYKKSRLYKKYLNGLKYNPKKKYELSKIPFLPVRLFKEFDFVKILSNFTPQNERDFEKHAFLHTHYLIVEIQYNTVYDNYCGATEGEMEIDITGYLNDNLQPIFFNN